MGLSIGSNVISTNNEYGYKANVLRELERAELARTDALNAASQALESMNLANSYKNSCETSESNAQTYMIAAQSFMTSANESATNAYNYAHSVDPDNIVHIDGDETITGIKTFTSDANDIQPIKIKNSKMDSTLSTIPSETTYSRYLFTDINDKDIGNYSLFQDADGNISTYMQAINYQSGSRDAATINLYNRADGTKYATCPTPPNAADNSTKIPTTQWVNNRIIDIMNSYKFVKEVGTVNGVGYYRLWTDNYCEQWWYKTIPGKSNALYNFPKTFKNMEYSLTASINSAKEPTTYNTALKIERVSTSQFRVNNASNSNEFVISWFANGYC